MPSVTNIASILSKRLHLFMVAIMLMVLSIDTSAQVSPFDQKHKLSKEELPTPSSADNLPPLEVVAPPAPSAATPNQQREEEPVDEEAEPVQEINNESADDISATSIEQPSEVENTVQENTSEDTAATIDHVESTSPIKIPLAAGGKTKNQSLFLFLMLIAATILTTLTISSNKSLVNNILRAVLNDNYLNLMYREQKKTGTFHYYILYFVFAVNGGLFLYFLLSRMVLNEAIPMLWRCVLLISIIYSLRHLFMSYIAFVYPFEKEAEQYAFTILIFNIFLGLLLLPINVFIAFSPEAISTFFLYGGLAIILIVYIFRQLRGMFISSRLLINNKFYFLLYLCAVEIAPVLLLIKYSGAYVS